MLIDFLVPDANNPKRKVPTMSHTLADILRTAAGRNMTRNELKVARAKLRRAGVTCLNKERTGAYTVDTSQDFATDVRAVEGTVIAQAAFEAVSA